MWLREAGTQQADLVAFTFPVSLYFIRESKKEEVNWSTAKPNLILPGLVSESVQRRIK